MPVGNLLSSNHTQAQELVLPPQNGMRLKNKCDTEPYRWHYISRRDSRAANSCNMQPGRRQPCEHTLARYARESIHRCVRGCIFPWLHCTCHIGGVWNFCTQSTREQVFCFWCWGRLILLEADTVTYAHGSSWLAKMK